MIHEINVHDHKYLLGGTRDSYSYLRGVIQSKLSVLLNASVDLNRIDVYNMREEFCEYNAGRPNRAIIFFNASRKGANEEKATRAFVNREIEYTYENMLQPRRDGIVITSQDGIELAEYHKDTNELFILFDLFATTDLKNERLFVYIIQQWKEMYWDKRDLENSWIHTSNKQELTRRVTDRVISVYKSRLFEDQERAESYERTIRDLKTRIKNSYDSMIQLRNQIEVAEKNLAETGGQFVKDLDLIVNHPKIEDLRIKNGAFVLYIPDVYCYDEDENRYYIGNCRVEIKMDDCDVRFFGDNPRRSYWTSEDPHPHVNGDNGEACLGNVSSTIAELCSRNEIYALALVCIDFLESANTEDPAGRCVKNWDMVDEEGNIIRHGGDDEDEGDCECDNCGDYFHEDDIYRVYNEMDDDGEPYEERQVCLTCRDEYYTYEENAGEWIAD